MKSIGKLIIFIFALFALAASAYAQSSREQLNQMVQQLQTTPNDNALRERIIRLGAEIKPAPAVPEEANRFFVRGNVFQKEAKDASGYELAISAYRDTLRLAPWWGDAYFNLAVALESASKFDEAIASIKFFMASVPSGSAEARAAQNRVYAIEAKSEMASRQATAAAQQIEKANSPQSAIAAKPAGPDFSGCWQGQDTAGTQYCEFSFERNGDNWIARDHDKKPLTIVKAQGRQLWVEAHDMPWATRHVDLVLSEDGQTIDRTWKDTQSAEEFARMKRDRPGMNLTDLDSYHRGSTLRRK